MIDSHCHLDYFPKEERMQIIENAFKNGVTLMQTIGVEFSKLNDVLEVANLHSNIYASVGTHPDYAHKDLCTTKQLVEACNKYNKIIGIGETGLDFYHSSEHKLKQIECFENHIEAAIITNKPIIVHSRNADTEMFEILLKAKTKAPDLKILMHCFTGGETFAKKLLELEAFISFSGIVTFKNAIEVYKSMIVTPLEKLIIETDAPYLAPNPFRGKRNEPAFIKHTAEFIANAKGVSFNEFCKITSLNFQKLFNIRVSL